MNQVVDFTIDFICPTTSVLVNMARVNSVYARTKWCDGCDEAHGEVIAEIERCPCCDSPHEFLMVDL